MYNDSTILFFFFKQKTAYEMRISDWSSDVCSSDLLFDCRLNLEDKPLSQAQLIEAVKAGEVLVPTVTDRIDAAVLSQAGPQLKLIASFGTGVDHIDLQSARQRGITVTNTPGVLTEDTADMTMALILSVPRRLAAGEIGRAHV